MSRKSKGINAERDLIHKFWGTGKWSAVRIAGSGSMKYPSADILATNKLRTLAITQRDAYIFLDYTDQDIHIHRRADSGYFVSREEIRYKQESFIERLFVYKDNPLKLQIKHFLECIKNADKINLREEDEIKSLDIALKIINSLKGNNRG